MRISKGIGVFVFAVITLALSACGGGGDGTSTVDDGTANVRVGQIIDSPVENLRYRTDTRSGYTNSEGEFEYVDGEEVTFSIGNIDFPPSIAKSFVTPLNLADVDIIHDDTVINICRLLQALDEDGIPDNGITIPANAEAAASSPVLFNVTEEEFGTLPEVINLVANSGSVNKTLIHRDDAALHCARHTGIDFKAGPFTADYYSNATYVASEIVERPAINYSWSDFNNIVSEDFHAIWTGELEVWFKPKLIDINFDASWSDVSLFVDGQEISTWSNSSKSIQHEFAVGVHDIRIEYHNNWHTTGFNVTFTDNPVYTMDQAISHIISRIDSDTQIIYVGAYNSNDLHNQATVSLGNITGKVFLFLSSYDAINWLIENPKDVKIMGVAYSSYGPRPTVAVGRSSPTFELDGFSYGYNAGTVSTPFADIEYMTGRTPDYFYAKYDLTKATFSVFDATFGGDLDSNGKPDGFAVHNNTAGGNSLDYGKSITLDAAGRAYVAGYSYNASGNPDMVIWRYTSSGILDTSFGGDLDSDGNPDGFAIHNGAAGGNSFDYGQSITLDTAGRAYVAGYSQSATGGYDMVIWRYTSNGSLDTSFGGDLDSDGNQDGYAVHNGAAGGNAADHGYSITLDTKGRIYVAGQSINAAGNNDMVIWRYTSNGSLDTSFGGDLDSDGNPDGYAVHNGAAGGYHDDSGYAIALDATGRVYVAGYSTQNNVNDDMVIWRYTSNGSPDSSFGGGNGYAIYHNAAKDYGRAITIGTAGRVYVSGYTGSSLTGYEMAIWCYTSDGNLDTSFGDDLDLDGNLDGFVFYPDAFGQAITLDTDGRVYVAGGISNASGDSDMAFWRYTSSGNLDTTFGGDLDLDGNPDGFVAHDGAAGGFRSESGLSITLDTAGRVYVTGFSANAANDLDMVVWRY